MLVTAAVFQPTMLPYVVVAVVGSVSHAVTAVPMLALVISTNACALGTAIRTVAKIASSAIPLPQSLLRREERNTTSLSARGRRECGRHGRCGDCG